MAVLWEVGWQRRIHTFPLHSIHETPVCFGFLLPRENGPHCTLGELNRRGRLFPVHAPAPRAERQLCSPTFGFWHYLRLSKHCLSCVCLWNKCQVFSAQSNCGMRVVEPRRCLGKEEKWIFPAAALVVCCLPWAPSQFLCTW